MLNICTWHTVCVWIDPIAPCEPLTIHHLHIRLWSPSHSGNPRENRLVTTPIPSTVQLAAFDQSNTKPDSSKCRQYAGCINWAAEHVQPDVAQVAHQLSHHLNNPSNTHMAIAIRTIQYLHCTRHLSLRYHTDKSHPVMTLSDSDWASCIDTCQSTSSHVTVMQGTAMMWKSA